MNHFLRVFNPDSNEDEPRADWPLDQFFTRWLVPKMRSRRKRPAAETTIQRKAACVQWWVLLMPERPPLLRIDPAMIATFAARLREATWRRSKNLSATPRRLSDVTIHRTVAEVVSIIRAASGASAVSGGRRPIRAGILPELRMDELCESLPDEPSAFPKATWTIEEAKAIAAAIDRFDVPCDRNGVGTRNRGMDMRAQLRAMFGLWFYSGHRATTYTIVEWSMLRELRPGEWFLDVPKSIKTSKADRVRVHPRLLELFDAIHGVQTGKIIALQLDYRTVYAWHRRICQLAGLPEGRLFSPQSWRRFHSQELAVLGLSQLTSLVQDSLGHSSPAITTDHYLGMRNFLIPRLPVVF